MLAWTIPGSAGIAAVVILVQVLTAPPTPVEGTDQYIEDHCGAVAEAVASIPEQAVPHGCRETAGAGANANARRNLSFPLSCPLELREIAPFRMSMSATDKDGSTGQSPWCTTPTPSSAR